MFTSYSFVFINDAKHNGYFSYERYLKKKRKLQKNLSEKNYSPRF